MPGAVVVPRLLDIRTAAAYCGLKPRTFRRTVPVAPVRLGQYERWDRLALDAFVDGLLGAAGGAVPIDWAARAGAFVEATARKRPIPGRTNG